MSSLPSQSIVNLKLLLFLLIGVLCCCCCCILRVKGGWDEEQGLLRRGYQQREFDYFKLALQWPVTYCRRTRRCCSSNACCSRSNSLPVFTIHGLWAEYNDGTWPSCCSGPEFDQKQISTLLKPLRKYWPSLSCGSPRGCHHRRVPFWFHEWEKHGTCSYPVVRDEYQFFLTTLNVYFKYNVTEVLFEAGYVPSNSEKYPLGGIISAIQNAFHATPDLMCSGDALEELRICFYKNFEVPYYLGELTGKNAEDDRIIVVKASQVKLKEVISFCETVELVSEEDTETSMHGGTNSFADARAKKIARFKRQRAAESKLLELRERKEHRGRSTKAAALSSPIETGEDDVLDGDGEEEREAWLATISLALCKAFDLLEMLNKEEEMLSAIKEKQFQAGENEFSQAVLDERTKKAETWHRDAAARARYTQPAAPITCATFAQDVIEGRAKVSQAHEHKLQPLIFGPASLVGRNPTTEREKIAAQVFQPRYRLPTMSIEEAGLTEMNMMNKWQERNMKLMEEANSSWYKDGSKSRPGEADEEDDDAAQDKARAWDDWKDDNPRGSGNKKLTPCG